MVAGTIRDALNGAARGTAKIDESSAKAWISQGQALLDAAANLAATTP